MLDIKRVLVPVDFSSEARTAVKWAVFLLRKTPGATLFLLHAFSYPRYADYLVWNDNSVEQRWQEEKRELERWQENIPSLIRSVFIVRPGPVASAVRQVCDQNEIDLVVMITRSRRGVRRVVRPNSSEEIVRTAPCPVLVLHLGGGDAKSKQLAPQEGVSQL